MKEFHCGEIVPGCNSRFRGNSDQQILAEVAVHARAAHGLESVPPSLVELVKSKIRLAA